ncbi:type I restriction enzyme S subunit [Salegentibacter sp. 24]|uniref:restriction endonuclease subunit S n=1 Tax=Salegentibacter sp. 24 TaxID=2183986 RepID=UPI00105E7900|nr:restriction endonuclease subunit S [Salegentibacter sp. 24]TDN81050.1 type I restriction enzyme S subunit [Salegentibacter sp. 24]
MKNKWISNRLEDITYKVLDFRGKTPLKLGMDWGGGEIRALSANNVEMGKVNFEKECYFGSDKLYKKWMNKGDCEEGDVLLTMEAPLGNVAQVPDNKKYILSQRTILLKFKKDEIDKKFIFHLFSGECFQKHLQQNSTGSTVLGIQQKKLAKIKLSYPKDLGLQHKIAKILNTVDAVIEKTEAAIAKYRAIKQGMMQNLFTRGINLQTGQLRPAYKDAPHLYKETELGWIPKQWNLGKLSDSAAGKHYSFTGGPFGSDLQTKDYTLAGVQIIQLQNIGDGEFINKSIVFTSQQKANDLRSCNIYPGDIIIAKMAEPVARACIIPDFTNRFLMASDGIRLSIDEKKFNNLFVKESINNNYFRSQAIAKSTGTTRERIGLTELRNIKFKYPQLEEQNLIAEKIQSMDKIILKEQANLAKHQSLKKGLMQDLLTGKVEVEV